MELNPLAIQQQIDPGFRSNPTLYEFTESPCKTCHNRNHDKDECLAGCPILNPPTSPTSSYKKVITPSEIAERESERVCEICGETYTKPAHKSYAEFAKRRVCGKSCAGRLKSKQLKGEN